MDELHWDAGLSLMGIGGCLKGWCRSNGDLNLDSYAGESNGGLNLDWSKLILTVPSASCWTKSKSGLKAGFWFSK